MTATPTDAPRTETLSERLGWRAKARPTTGFGHVLAAGAGFFAVLAVIAFAIEIGGDDVQAPGVVATLALGVAAWLVGTKLNGPARAACVTAIVLCTPAVWAFALLGSGDATTGDLRWVYALSLLVYAVTYLVGWTRGRAILLGLALLTFASLVTSFTADEGAGTPIFPTFESSDSSDLPFGDDSFDVSSSDESAETAVLALVIGIGFLAAAAALDRRGLTGAATPFLVVGALEAISGAAVLGGEESVMLGGALAALAGAAVALVGARGAGRRASIWIGIVVVVAGLFVVIADGASQTGWSLGGIAAVLALLLGAAGIAVAPRLQESLDGEPDQRAEPAGAPPSGRALQLWIVVAVAAVALLVCSIALDWFGVAFDADFGFSIDEAANAWEWTVTGIAVGLGGLAAVPAMLRIGGYRIPVFLPLALGAVSTVLIAVKLVAGVDVGTAVEGVDTTREVGIYLGLVAAIVVTVASAVLVRVDAATPVPPAVDAPTPSA